MSAQNRGALRYNEIRPTRAIVGDLGTGSIDFEFSCPPGEKMDLQSAYLNVVIALTKDAAWELGTGIDNVNLQPHDGLSQNVMVSLFKSGTLQLNDKVISRVEQFGPHSTMHKLVYMNKDELDSDGSPIRPTAYDPLGSAGTDLAVAARRDVETIFLAGAPKYVDSAVASKRKRVLASALNFNGNLGAPEAGFGAAADGKTLVLHLSHPLAPFFDQLDFEGIPSSKLRLSLTVDANYKTKIQVSPDPIKGVNVSSLFLNIPTYNVPEYPIDLNFSTIYNESSVTQRVFNSNNIQFSLNSGKVDTVLVAFGPSAETDVVDTNELKGIFVTAGTKSFDSLYINYGGKSYPQTQYSFGANLVDARRAYEDYAVFSSARSQASAPCLDFKHWINSPIFVFSVTPEIGNPSSILTVNTVSNGFTATGELNIYVMATYKQELNIQYNESALPMSTTTKILN